MWLVLLFMTSFFITASTQHCKNVSYSLRGYYLRNHLISSPNVKNIGQCLVACSQDQRCQSINFRFFGSICELNDADRETKPWEYKVNEGYAYSDYPIKAPFHNNVYNMAPLWLKAHASYIDGDHSVTAHQFTFLGKGVVSQPRFEALLKVPLIATGVLSDETPLTVNMTVITDASIGQSSDSDPLFGLSDGTNFIGFQTRDRYNYEEFVPCYGMEGTSGASLSGTKTINNATFPLISDKFYPEEFVFTFKLDTLWDSCFTAHDGGFSKTALYSKRLNVSNGLTLEVYAEEKQEKVGIKNINVNIMKTG